MTLSTSYLIAELRKRLTPEEYAAHKAEFDTLEYEIRTEGMDAWFGGNQEEIRGHA